MLDGADKTGLLTAQEDERITHVGEKIRKGRLDELPQLINILRGEMTFVGTRPEVPKYVKCYDDEMYATLLLPAGITSEASLTFRDEDKLLNGSKDINTIYVNRVLPLKMKINLDSIIKFSLMNETRIFLKTLRFALNRNED